VGSVDQKLHDAIIKYQLDLRRLEAGTRKNVLAILTKMQKEIVASLANEDSITAYSKARKNELLKQIKIVVNEYYAKAQGELQLNVDGLAKIQTQHVASMLADSIGINIAIALPTETAMVRLASNVLIEGGPMAEWWGKLASGTSFNLTNAIRQGAAQSETNAQIITRIIGKAGQAGVLDISRRNAAALVHTSMQSIANDSREMFFEANADVIKEVQWFSALDGHVCPRCMALSGRKWKNSDAHEPVAHTVPYRNPPIHWNDRCVLLPITKTFKEMGIDMPEVAPGQRASRDGPVDAQTTFEEFLNRQTKEQQDEQLGVGRAQLWRDGKITLAQLIDGTGRELTLAELKAKYDK
jgi:hypothetical protein